MPVKTFSISEDFASTPKEAIDYLIELPLLEDLNPILESAILIGSGENGSSYAIHERPHVGPFRYSVRFRATMLRVRDEEMFVLVDEIPLGATMRMTTTATATPEGCRVDEWCEIDAPWGFGRYMVGQAHRSHVATFAKVREQFATTPVRR